MLTLCFCNVMFEQLFTHSYNVNSYPSLKFLIFFLRLKRELILKHKRIGLDVVGICK